MTGADAFVSALRQPFAMLAAHHVQVLQHSHACRQKWDDDAE